MNAIDRVHEALQPLGHPVQFEVRPTSFPGISFEFFNEAPALHGDGEAVQESLAVQVDIWTKAPNIVLKNQVKAAMKEKGFLFAHSDSSLEQEARLYRWMLIFNYYYESEG